MDNNFKMLPIRQRQVLDVIEKNKFEKIQFDFYPITHDRFKITYKAIPRFQFTIDERNNYQGLPGSNGNPSFSSKRINWEHGLKGMETWLTNLRENLIVGDPWAEDENIKDFFSESNFDNYEELLTEQDQKEFSKKLDLFAEQLNAIGVDSAKVASDIEHLKVMSAKVSKKDLMLLLLGNVTGYILTGIIPLEKVNSIWSMIGQLFHIAKTFLLTHGN